MANFKTKIDIFDHVTPSVWVQDNIVAPQGEFRPAAWLPVLWEASNKDQGKDAFVISSGKPVAMDTTGRLVPAGLRGAFNKTTATTVLTYTATDYEWGVIDLTTGQRYATNGTTSYTALQVAKALVERGLVREDVVSNNPASSNDDVTAIVEAFLSLPVGVMMYNVHVWAGLAEEGDQWYTNYCRQHAVQFITEKQMRLPFRVASTTTSDLFDVSAITITSAASGAGDFPQPGEVWDIDALVSLARYDLAGTEPIVALALAEKPVAKNTSRTPLSCDVATVLLKEKTSLALVKKAGDFFLDGEVGLLFIHADTYDTLVTDNDDPTFSYSFYESNGVADSARWVYFDGVARPGDKVSIDEMSNFVVKGSSEDILDSTDAALGTLLFVYTEPKDLLDKVKTAWTQSSFATADKMPGTATGGYSDLITYAAEPVSDSVAVITIRI